MVAHSGRDCLNTLMWLLFVFCCYNICKYCGFSAILVSRGCSNAAVLRQIEVCPISTSQTCAFLLQTLRPLFVATDPIQHSTSVFLLKLLSAELETQSYYLVNYNVRGYLSWELRPLSVYCATLVIKFP